MLSHVGEREGRKIGILKSSDLSEKRRTKKCVMELSTLRGYTMDWAIHPWKWIAMQACIKGKEAVDDNSTEFSTSFFKKRKREWVENGERKTEQRENLIKGRHRAAAIGPIEQPLWDCIAFQVHQLTTKTFCLADELFVSLADCRYVAPRRVVDNGIHYIRQIHCRPQILYKNMN